MTQSPSQGPVVEVKPQPNVYTILLLVAVIALAVAIGMCFWRLTAASPVGYGLEIRNFFDALTSPR
ncbi:MAG TPA: hypothetical protein VM695_14565 [Phycisphaerae bacterium]|nr:hypothetical protein [Phycisphaerae bacterium]